MIVIFNHTIVATGLNFVVVFEVDYKITLNSMVIVIYKKTKES